MAERRKWTDEEIKYLKRYYHIKGAEKCANRLGRSKNAVISKAMYLGLSSNRYFTENQAMWIEHHVGLVSYKEMAKRTHHSYNAIKTFIWRNNLSRMTTSNNIVSMAEYARLVGCCDETVSRVHKKHGLKVEKVGKYCCINMDEAVEWLRTHPERWDATKCEKWYFEQFPWFEEKRKKDFERMVEKRWG